MVIEENKTYMLGAPCRVFDKGVARDIPGGGLLY
jgi:hypothetical protein